MSEPIKVGDLVVVVHTCCARSGKFLGAVRLVDGVAGDDSLPCSGCGYIGKPPLAIIECGGHPTAAPFYWLKRIPPLSELEREKRDEEITA